MEPITKPRRRRILTGTLVASTNSHRSVIARRLIVKVKYLDISFKTLSEKVTEIRTCYEE